MIKWLSQLWARLTGKAALVETQPEEPIFVCCVHAKTVDRFTIKVHGHDMDFQSDKYCPPCLKEFLERSCTFCATCDEPILPGQPVAFACVGSKYPYTHMYWDCGEGLFFCGRWGNGKLVTLHEIDPEKYPVEGKASVAAQVLASPGDGGMVVNVDPRVGGDAT